MPQAKKSTFAGALSVFKIKVELVFNLWRSVSGVLAELRLKLGIKKDPDPEIEVS